MAVSLSRRGIADYAAKRLLKGEDTDALIKELAAYLVATRTTREMDLLVASIEEALQRNGVVVADVTTARPMSATLRVKIEKMLGKKELHLREHIDKRVIGGVRIELPDSQFDGTIEHQLIALKGAK